MLEYKKKQKMRPKKMVTAPLNVALARHLLKKKYFEITLLIIISVAAATVLFALNA